MTSEKPKKSTAGKRGSSNSEKSYFNRETYMRWFEEMLRIRKFEERANQLYIQKKIRGFCHLYIGQEAIAAGLVSAARITDPLITAYRQHGIGLIRGISSRAAMAELYGKATGNVGGKGGSMHYFSKEGAYFGGHGIVGGQIGIGAGLGFAEKYKGTDNVAIAMFGDGAARQGILFESFNMAMTWKLPVVFICENNLYAMGTSVERTSNVTDMYKIGLAFDMPSEQVDGMSPEAVHEALERALERGRKGEGPTFLEIRTYRYRGHSMSDPAKYRTKDEEKAYKEIDPIEVTRQRILDNKFATLAEVEAIEAKIDAEIDDCVEFSENSPWPDPKELYANNYVQQDYPFMD
jgi:pyruvate dehydrogenase E1 component alpha subunit